MTALPVRRFDLGRADPRILPRPTAETVQLLPQTVHLALYQGDDARLELVCTDPDGQPSDLSGASALSQIRASFDTDVLAEFTATITGNVIELHLPHAQATGLSPGRGVWDAQITDTDGEVTTLVAGNVTISAEVSW